MARDQGIASEVERLAPSSDGEFYRQFFDNAIEGLCVVDFETGIIRECNKALLRLTGYERSELLGQPQTIFHRQEEISAPHAAAFGLHRSDNQENVYNSHIITKFGEIKEVEIKAGVVEIGGQRLIQAFFRNVSEECRNRRERESTLDVIRMLNDRNHTHELIRNLTEYLQRWSGCDAVGIRLRDGDDFPYFESRGFSNEFVIAENSLCQRDAEGQIVRDANGNALLDCMCGNILQGRFDPKLPFFTENGSFWSNGTTQLLASSTEAERQAHTRNRCNSAGYESVALVPLRYGDQILGLLQLNHRRPNRFTTEFIAFLENISCQIALALIQRETRVALEFSEERYRGLFENMTEGYAYCRMIFENGKPVDWIYLDVNAAFETLTGLKNVAGKRVSEVIPGIRDSDMALFDIYARVSTTEKPEKFERYVEALKSWFQVSVYSPAKEYFVAVFDVITDRKNVEIALQKSEERFSKAFQSSPMPMTITSLVDHRIIDVNEAFETCTDYSREELIGRNFGEFLFWIDCLEIREAKQTFLCEGKYQGLEYDIHTRSGKRRIGRFSTEIVEIAGEPCILTVTEDITERKQMENSIRESEARYRSLFENMTEGYGYHRMIFENGEPVDYVFLAVNKSFEKITGLSNVVDQRVTEVIPRIRESNPELFAVYGRVAATGNPEMLESYIDALKSWYSISVYSPKKDHFVTVFENITARKNTEIALRKSEELFSKAFNGSPLTMVITSLVDRRIINVNEAFENVTEYLREEVLGRNFIEVGLFADKETLERAIEAIAVTGKYRGYQFPIRTKSGKQVLMQLSAEIVEIAGEWCALTVAEDITDQMKAEIALRKSEEVFAKAFHNSPMTMAITSMADHRYIDVNEAFEKSTGYMREEVIGRDFREIDIWCDPAGMEESVRLIQSEGKYRELEYVIRNRSGKRRIGRFSAETVEINGELCVLTVAEDITDHKKAEDELRKSEERFSKSFNCSPTTMVITSLVDNRIIDVNETFEKSTGYAREEVLNCDFRILPIWTDPHKAEELAQYVSTNGQYHGLEFEVRIKSGEIRIGRFSAETVEIAGEKCALTVAEDITEHRRAVEKLAAIARDKSELLEKLNDAQHMAAIGSWEWNLQTHEVWWSDETYSIFGVMPWEYVPSFEANGKFIHPDDFLLYEESFSRSLETGKPLDFDFRLTARDGQLKHCHAKGKVVADGAGRPLRFVGTIMDITAKKRAETALRASDERFRLTFEFMSNGITVYDVVGEGEDFLIKEFNPAAERICRTKRDDIVGKSVLQVFPGIKNIGLFDAFRRVWRTGIPEHHSASYYHDERFSLWAENYVFKLPTGEVVAIIDDITDRLKAEADLRKSETWHRSLIELGVSVYIVLDENRRIGYASPPVEKIFGWKPAELLQRSIFDFLAAEDAEAASRFFTEILHAPRRKKRIRARTRCKNGEIKIAEIFAVNLLDEPAVQGIVLSGHDITDQVRDQERLEASRTELTHASRLAAMGELATGMAHEINQPLAVMATWTEIAMREIRDHLSGDKQEAMLSLIRIDNALERSGIILRNMKDFARKSEPRVTRLSLVEVVEDVRQLVAHQLRDAGVAFSADMPLSLPPAMADRTQIQQVLMNLVLNAVESMESVPSNERHVEIRVQADDDMLEVAVSDTGCGIPPDQLESIFDPFQSTKPNGLGLGLSICRSIVQWHSGRIWAARNAERGTTITFTLPIAKEQSSHATKTHHLHRGRRTRST